MVSIKATSNSPAVCLDSIDDLARQIDSRGFRPRDIAENATVVSDFLVTCADSLNTPERTTGEFLAIRDAFIKAGLQSLATRQRRSNSDWLQISVRPVEDERLHSELYQQIANLARKLIGESTIQDFFFMNKDPGMRLRFRYSPVHASDVTELVYSEAQRWSDEGFVDYVEHGVYEPETQLFGGPASMPFVHSLFTVDSLFWLDVHSQPGDSADESSPAWVTSLTTLRTLFDGLGINGWEDVGVWDRIRDNGGRQLGEFKDSFPSFNNIASEIRDVWSREDLASGSQLDPEVSELIARYGPAIADGSGNWRNGYFSQPGATMGPREAAAFYVIFHWNRAALSATEQAIIAESLAGREG